MPTETLDNSNTPLARLSDADLRKELQRREEESAARERNERYALNKRLFDQRGVILPLLEHSRTSCSDANPSNDYTTAGRNGNPRCTKCFLMGLSEADLPHVELSLEISGRYRENHPSYEAS